MALRLNEWLPGEGEREGWGKGGRKGGMKEGRGGWREAGSDGGRKGGDEGGREGRSGSDKIDGFLSVARSNGFELGGGA